MKDKITSNLLKTIAIILLIIGLPEMPYQYYELMRFVLTAIFIWFVIIEKDSEKQGWKYTFGALAILFNPFFKLKIEESGWKIIDIITAILLLINIIESKLDFRNLSFSQFRLIFFMLLISVFHKETFKKYWLIYVLVVFLIVSGAYNKYLHFSAEQRAKMEGRRVMDSIEYSTRMADSLAELDAPMMPIDSAVSY